MLCIPLPCQGGALINATGQGPWSSRIEVVGGNEEESDLPSAEMPGPYKGRRTAPSRVPDVCGAVACNGSCALSFIDSAINYCELL